MSAQRPASEQRAGRTRVLLPEEREAIKDIVTIRHLSKPGKGIRFLEFVSLPPPRPSPTGEGAVMRQIQITAAISHMDGYETVTIFAANEFPPPVGEG